VVRGGQDWTLFSTIVLHVCRTTLEIDNYLIGAAPEPLRIISAGGSPKTLQTVLGHRSAAFSLTVYGHLFDADLDALADRLDVPEKLRAERYVEL
jgi:integrase